MSLLSYRRIRSGAACAVFGVASLLCAQRQLFHSYGPADGLTNLNVRCLLQDRVGYIWVGTDNGLFRYDGSRFRGYGHADGLSNTEITSLAESPTGTLWVGTNDGVAIQSGDRFQAVDIGQQGTTDSIRFDSAGQIYLENDSGIVRGIPVETGKYSFHLAAAGPVSALFVNAGEVWFQKQNMLWRLKGDSVEPLPASLGLPHDQWHSMIRDSLGNRWIRSETRLFELPRERSRFVDRSKGIPEAAEADLYSDNHGRVLVPTISGIYVVSESGQTIIDSQHGLPADPSGPMLIDREELLWMGTNGAGLVRRLGHGEWLAWTESDGLLRNSVWAIQSDPAGNVWVGTNGGLTIIDRDGKISRSFTHRDGLASDRVLSIARASNGNFFVGTDPAGISEFNSKGSLLHTYKAESGYTAQRVSSMAFDHDGLLWAVGIGGCFRSHDPIDARSKPGSLHFDRMDVPELPGRVAFRSVIADSGGIMWIASSKGLARFDGNQWHVITAKDGLRSSDLGVVAKVKDELWVAYRDALGMARINPTTSRIAPVDAPKEIVSDQIYGIASDRKSGVWIATDMGVASFQDGQWKHYGSEDGLVWNDTDSLALHVDSDDNIWIGTSGGLSKFAQPEFQVESQPPPVTLTSIAGPAGHWLAADDPILPFSARAIALQFAALTFEAGSSLRYRYKLSGIDKDWVETSERAVQFAALPPGQYVFEVTAAGPNGVWNPVPARFSFSISTPWWQSWWFVGVLVMVTLLLGSLFTRLRIRALEAQKRSLKEQVADRTAELVASHRMLEEIAYCDALTHMPNRRSFTEDFRNCLTSSEPVAPFVLLLIDLDFFKEVNDTYGHDAGDVVLIETASRIRSEVRQSDKIARLGGDEFAVLLLSAPEADATEAICNRLLQAIRVPIPYKGLTLEVGCSIGLARSPEDGDTQDSLYRSADKALYDAKQAGRNVHRWHWQTSDDNAAASLYPQQILIEGQAI